MPIPSAVQTFDIFNGRFGDNGVVWIEAVEGLAASKKRMVIIAAEKPGPYFVFSSIDHLIVAVSDTTRKAASESTATEDAA